MTRTEIASLQEDAGEYCVLGDYGSFEGLKVLYQASTAVEAVAWMNHSDVLIPKTLVKLVRFAEIPDAP